jgi:hypothetical protein
VSASDPKLTGPWFAARLQVYVNGKFNPFKHCASSGIRWVWVITNGIVVEGSNPTSSGCYYRRHATKKDAAELAAKYDPNGGVFIPRILNITCQQQVAKYAPKATP